MLKVGQRYRIKKLDPHKRYSMGVTTEMTQYAGKIATVAIVHENGYSKNGYSYSLDIDNNAWAWTEDMLENVCIFTVGAPLRHNLYVERK